MNIKYNYLIGSTDSLTADYDIDNRPDPDVDGCEKLYNDVIETYFSNKYDIKNFPQQFKCDVYWKKKWESYEKLNNKNPVKRTKEKNPPFYTIKIEKENEEWLLSTDYLGPSVYWCKKSGLRNNDIIEILNTTRTIGGHITWPRGSHLKYKINTSRAGENSFYDRIDWTLYLVQFCYRFDFDEHRIKEEFTQQYLPEEIGKRADKLISAICESKSWFQAIGDFENFCNQFILKGSFVDEKFEINWLAKQFPVYPEDYKKFARNNTIAVQERNTNILISKYRKILDELFKDGGETYTLVDLQIKFKNEGVIDEKDFSDALDNCIAEGWITDCGNDTYTR